MPVAVVLTCASVNLFGIALRVEFCSEMPMAANCRFAQKAKSGLREELEVDVALRVLLASDRNAGAKKDIL